MKKIFIIVTTLMLGYLAKTEDAKSKNIETDKFSPWIGKYPMSLITRTRTANTVGKGRVSVALRLQNFNYDQVMAGDDYVDMEGDNDYSKILSVFVTKWGWAENHHLALGLPYIWSDFNSSSTSTKHEGLGNIFIFEKWKFVEETEFMPAISADIWYFFGSGDSENKIGSDDDSAKFAMSFSKAWEKFSLHFNPAYRWSLHDSVDMSEINLGCFYNINKSFKLTCEYNFTGKEHKGKCHDIVPGVLWKPSKNSSVKLGAVINVKSDMKYKDDLGFCMKLFYKF